ncbi:pectinesterase family protein [Oceanicola sp. S124]|uniref:pectinesterase family protein n=1 Tax=Oceanicola sp. S124 TaxID=1042378 RepID=UPI00025596D8|nr:pectinesterase family protein [Oceanicola sp. S124]
MTSATLTDWALRHHGIRPMLTDDQAAQVTLSEVLRYTGPVTALRDEPWEPPREVPDIEPEIRVTPGTGSLQQAVEQAIAKARATGQGGRVVIGVLPGIHTGLLYLPKVEIDGDPLSFTLLGLGATPADAQLAESIDAEMPGLEYCARFDAQFSGASPETRAIHARIAARETLSTHLSSVVRNEAPDTQVYNLTIRNTYGCSRSEATPAGVQPDAQGRFPRGQHQAVALLSAGGDRLVLGRVRLSSWQDTLYLQSPDKASTCRSYLFDCAIEGDVDFIFGQSTAWFESCEIRARGDRDAHCWLTAPATHARTPWGFVFHACRLTHDGSARMGQKRTNLGRQWFEGVKASPYGLAPEATRVIRAATSGVEPPTISDDSLLSVGKCLWLDCALGSHINLNAPWDDWSGPGYTASGQLRDGPRQPRYRPPQTGPADMARFLHNWPGAGNLSALGPDFPWLGEWRSHPLIDPA